MSVSIIPFMLNYIMLGIAVPQGGISFGLWGLLRFSNLTGSILLFLWVWAIIDDAQTVMKGFNTISFFGENIFLGTMTFCQLAILSNSHFVNLPFYQLAILPTYHFISLLFCQLTILSLAILSTCHSWSWHFVSLPYNQLGIFLLTILSTT